jgi:cytochrome c oxidase assembly protein subunit 11
MSNDQQHQNLKRSNRKVALLCGVFFASMVGAAYAAVPLYDLFCRMTGFGGTTQVAAVAPEHIGKRRINVRFDANTSGGLPWHFVPEVREREVALGETVLVNFKVTNTSSRTTWGTASYNVTPEMSGGYFAKLQCFCFTSQSLDAGEEMNMPVVFFVDPALDEDKDLDRVKTITLSYTFFPSSPGPVAQAGKKDSPGI